MAGPATLCFRSSLIQRVFLSAQRANVILGSLTRKCMPPPPLPPIIALLIFPVKLMRYTQRKPRQKSQFEEKSAKVWYSSFIYFVSVPLLGACAQQAVCRGRLVALNDDTYVLQRTKLSTKERRIQVPLFSLVLQTIVLKFVKSLKKGCFNKLIIWFL